MISEKVDSNYLHEIESIDEKGTVKLILDKNNIPINITISDNLKSKNILDTLIYSTLSKKFTLSEKISIEEDKVPKDLKIFEKSNAFNPKEELDKKEITITIHSIKKNNNMEEISDKSFSSGNSDIGFTENDFFVVLGYMYIKKRPNNLILKYLPINSDFLDYSYFEKYKPTKEEFIQKLNIKKENSKKLLIVPISSLGHLSLMLISDLKLFLLDFGLIHSIDKNFLNISDESNDCYKKIEEKISEEKLEEIEGILKKNIYNEKGFNLEREIKSILKDLKISEDIFNLIKTYILLETQFAKKYVLDEDNCFGDVNAFHNIELSKNITSLINFAIQGSESCGYFCVAALLLTIDRNYVIEDIIKHTKSGRFQIEVIKLLFEEIFSNDQKIILILDNKSEKIETNNEYKIYKSKEFKVFVRNIEKININLDNNRFKIESKKIINFDSVNEMLLQKGFIQIKN